MSERQVLAKFINLLKAKENYKIVNLLATIVFGFILFLFVSLPTLSSFTEQQRDNALRLKIVQEQEKKIRDLEILNQKYENEKNYIGFFETVFPNKLKQQEIIDFIIRKSKIYNLKINVANFSRPDINATSSWVERLGLKNNLKEITFNLNLLGTRSNIINFLKDLEKSSRIFSINSITINKKESINNTSNNFEIFLNGYIFYWESEIYE